MKNIFCFYLVVIITAFSCKEKGSVKVSKKNFKEIRESAKYSLDKTKYLLHKDLKQANSILFKGKAYRKLGVYYDKINQKDSAYFFYNKSTSFLKKVKDSSGLAHVFLKMAIIESKYSDYDKSDLTAVKALGYATEKRKKYLPSIYNCLGINARNKKEYDNALRLYNKAIDYSGNNKDVVIYSNNRANIYKDKRSYKESIKILNDLLNKTFLEKELITKARIIDNLAHVKWLDDTRYNSLPEFIEAEEIRKIEKDLKGLLASYDHLSDFFKFKSTSKSLGYAYKMYTISKIEKSPLDIIKACDKILELERPIEAIKYAIERNKIKDNLQEAKEKAQYKYALIKYESKENEKKAIENELLAEKQNTENIILLFTTISLVTLLLIYLWYNHQQAQKEKVTEVYKTETRLAKKIHDELANDVYLAMNKMQKEASPNLSLLQDLEKIYATTRDISHENNQVLTGDRFENYLKQLFIEFSIGKTKVMHTGISSIAINNLSKEKQIVVYRVIQELLINMQKHSKATIVMVAFKEERNTIYINYKDNGIGTLLENIEKGHRNMDNRIKSIKGSIKFESEKEKGLKASIQFKK